MSMNSPSDIPTGQDHAIEGGSDDRRQGPRTRTVLRTVKLRSMEDEGLARLQNISDHGMKLLVGLPVDTGDVVTIFFTDADHVEAQVVWTRDQCCGVELAQPIDSAALLSGLARTNSADLRRAMRIAATAPGIAYTEHGVHPIALQDISQRGMKIRHGEAFTDGLQITVRLHVGLEARGVVRWSKDDLAGIELIEPLSTEDLGSSRRLCATD